MKKIIGYLIAIAGLVLVALSIFKTLSIPGIKPVFITIAGAILIIIGIFLTFGKESYKEIEQAEEEVPIYHGEGKNRKIVGYRRKSR